METEELNRPSDETIQQLFVEHLQEQAMNADIIRKLDADLPMDKKWDLVKMKYAADQDETAKKAAAWGYHDMKNLDKLREQATTEGVVPQDENIQALKNRLAGGDRAYLRQFGENQGVETLVQVADRLLEVAHPRVFSMDSSHLDLLFEASDTDVRGMAATSEERFLAGPPREAALTLCTVMECFRALMNNGEGMKAGIDGGAIIAIASTVSILSEARLLGSLRVPASVIALRILCVAIASAPKKVCSEIMATLSGVAARESYNRLRKRGGAPTGKECNSIFGPILSTVSTKLNGPEELCVTVKLECLRFLNTFVGATRGGAPGRMSLRRDLNRAGLDASLQLITEDVHAALAPNPIASNSVRMSNVLGDSLLHVPWEDIGKPGVETDPEGGLMSGPLSSKKHSKTAMLTGRSLKVRLYQLDGTCLRWTHASKKKGGSVFSKKKGGEDEEDDDFMPGRRSSVVVLPQEADSKYAAVQEVHCRNIVDVVMPSSDEELRATGAYHTGGSFDITLADGTIMQLGCESAAIAIDWIKAIKKSMKIARGAWAEDVAYQQYDDYVCPPQDVMNERIETLKKMCSAYTIIAEQDVNELRSAALGTSDATDPAALGGIIAEQAKVSGNEHEVASILQELAVLCHTLPDAHEAWALVRTVVASIRNVRMHEAETTLSAAVDAMGGGAVEGGEPASPRAAGELKPFRLDGFGTTFDPLLKGKAVGNEVNRFYQTILNRLVRPGDGISVDDALKFNSKGGSAADSSGAATALSNAQAKITELKSKLKAAEKNQGKGGSASDSSGAAAALSNAQAKITELKSKLKATEAKLAAAATAAAAGASAPAAATGGGGARQSQRPSRRLPACPRPAPARRSRPCYPPPRALRVARCPRHRRCRGPGAACPCRPRCRAPAAAPRCRPRCPAASPACRRCRAPSAGCPPCRRASRCRAREGRRCPACPSRATRSPRSSASRSSGPRWRTATSRTRCGRTSTFRSRRSTTPGASRTSSRLSRRPRRRQATPRSRASRRPWRRPRPCPSSTASARTTPTSRSGASAATRGRRRTTRPSRTPSRASTRRS